MNKAVPVYLLSGFLGSGKTTLLKHILAYYAASGMKAAVVMNEIGEVNVDGQEFGEHVPVAEMLSGCVCCSISSDLPATIIELCRESNPDAVIIETTGAANTEEVIHGVAEASLQFGVELQTVVTVVDAPLLLELSRTRGGNTLRLMEKQIRCADWLIVNKTEKLGAQETTRIRDILRGWNLDAPIEETVRCSVDLERLHPQNGRSHAEREASASDIEQADDRHDHDHVMVYTHYFEKDVDRKRFEQFIRELPGEVYRAKGILRFPDRNGPMLFQYAYRELEMIRTTVNPESPNVAVFIGERFSRENLISQLKRL